MLQPPLPCCACAQAYPAAVAIVPLGCEKALAGEAARECADRVRREAERDGGVSDPETWSAGDQMQQLAFSGREGGLAERGTDAATKHAMECPDPSRELDCEQIGADSVPGSHAGRFSLSQTDSNQ